MKYEHTIKMHVALSHLRKSTNLNFTLGAGIRYFTFYAQLLADV